MNIVDLILRRVLGTFINRGINAGIDRASSGGKSRNDMTPEERKRARAARQTAKRARQAARLTRRMR